MSSSMSHRLMHATRISIDTSFKRVHGWQEFEIETWDNFHMRCEYLIVISHAIDQVNSGGTVHFRPL